MDLQHYLAELQSRAVLTHEQEDNLWQAYTEQGSIEARQALIEHYQPLVFKIAARFGLQSPWLFDLIQEGTVGLIEAVEKFDSKRNVAFSLFGFHRIRGRMLNYLQKEYPAGQFEILEETLTDQAACTAEQVERSFLLEQVRSAVKRLPAKEQLALSGVYLQDQEPKELAEQMEISVSYLYRLQKQGIRRVRGMLSRLMQHW